MPTVDDFLGGVVRKPRKPGDFLRMANDTPQVAHPTKRTKKGAPNLVPAVRPSGLGDQLEDGYALTKWTERQMVKGWASIGADVADEFQRLLSAPDLATAKQLAANIEGLLIVGRRLDIGQPVAYKSEWIDEARRPKTPLGYDPVWHDTPTFRSHDVARMDDVTTHVVTHWSDGTCTLDTIAAFREAHK